MLRSGDAYGTCRMRVRDAARAGVSVSVVWEEESLACADCCIGLGCRLMRTSVRGLLSKGVAVGWAGRRSRTQSEEEQEEGSVAGKLGCWQ